MPSAFESDDGRIQNRTLGVLLVVGSLLLLGYVSKAMLLVTLVIALVIFMHELGHYLTARITGMKATEFYLGFGPRLFSFRRGETEFGVKPILAGAYVKVVGMTNLDEVEENDEPRTYRRQTYPKRLLVASAGSLMHFIMALLGLLALFLVVGEPVTQGDSWEISTVVEQSADGELSAAASAGLKAGDQILAVGSQPTPAWSDLVDAVRNQPGSFVRLEVLRDGQTLFRETKLGVDEDGYGILGVGGQRAVTNVSYNAPTAIQKTISEFVIMVGQSFKGIWSIFANLGDVADRVFSPPNDPSANENLETRPVSVVGAVQIGASDRLNGSERLQLFVAFNVFVGIFNLLPLLPLDGGHIAIATYERLREGRSGQRYMIDTARLMPITYAVVAFLAFFGLGALYLDIANPLGF